MRIISGKYKSLVINAPKNIPSRPTTDMAKSGLFNILHNAWNWEGKTILDLFKDNDTVIGDDNITPQSRYSADFNIQWGTGFSVRQLTKLKFWLNKNQNFLASLGYHPDNPKCAIGKGIIGKLVNDPEIERQRIYGATKILGVRYS